MIMGNDTEEPKRTLPIKPEDVSWGDWMGPKSMTHRHEYMAHLATFGLNQKQIAIQCGLTQSRVCIIFSTTAFQELLKKTQEKVLGQDAAQRFKSILPGAIETAETIMNNMQEKSNLRADVAFRFMDRALGKPKQAVEHTGSVIKDLLEALDRQNDIEVRPAIDITEESRTIEDTDDAEIGGQPEADLDPIDQWVTDTYGKKSETNMVRRIEGKQETGDSSRASEVSMGTERSERSERSASESESEQVRRESEPEPFTVGAQTSSEHPETEGGS